MPFVRVDYMKGQYSKQELSDVSKVIQSILMKEFDVPAKDYFQIFQSHEDFEFYYDPNYFDVSRADKLLYIYITCAPGRSQPKKLRFYKELSSELSIKCTVTPENIFIVLIEAERENWSFGNGLAQALNS
jgi:phenylpyruvate tautomerase PptA (4-oxalocrotonate tautomerase family)